MSDFLLKTAGGIILGIGLGAVAGQAFLGDVPLGVSLGVGIGAAAGLSLATWSG